MPDRFWVGGTANWDGTIGTKWSATSGGPGGASVPTSADDVFFTNLSTGTCTIAAGNTGARSINCTGFAGAIAGTAGITVAGSITLSLGMTYTHTGTVTITGTGTLTTAGRAFSSVTVNGAAITVTLGDALNLSTRTLSVALGTFTTNNFNVTAGTLTSTSTNTRTINLGSSTVTLSESAAPIVFTTSTNLTFNAGTSTISLSGNITTFNPGAADFTFHNVSFTNTTAATRALAYTGLYTYNRLTVAAPATAGVTQVTFAGRNTFNDGLATSGTAGNRRVWFRGVTYGLAQTLTVNGAGSLTDADFRDIYVIGTAAPISGTRIGDLRGIRGITASTPKTVYWNLVGGGNWSANAWAATSGGAVSTGNFPLAQDTAVIENTGLGNLGTVTLDAAVPYIGTFNGSTRTLTANIQLGASNYTVYGDWVMGSGTGFAGGATLTFSGRNTQTITSAGKQFVGGVVVDSYGGTVELADALNIGSNTLTVTNGTFDTQSYNVTAGSFSSSNSNVRTINLGSSTVTVSSISPVAFGIAATNLTLNAGTSTIACSTTATYGFEGGGQTFHNVSCNAGANSFSEISGQNTFNNFSITPPASAGLGILNFTSDQTVTGTLTCAGATAVRRICVRAVLVGATRTLTVNSLSAQDCDFRDITIAGAAAGSSPTRAGDCGGNTGITFPAPKTVYWNLAGAQNWSATGWATSSGGTPDINQFPLAQDTAVFDNTGSVTGTILLNADWNIGTFDASARTSAMTLDPGTGFVIVCGNWLFGTGVTVSNTTCSLSFSGRGTQTITSNGVTFGVTVVVETTTGTVQLADALTLSSNRNLAVGAGTFDAVTYNVTIGRFSNGSVLPNTVRMGSGTWTLSGTGQVWSYTTASGSNTLLKGTANIVLSDTSTTAREFAGGGASYNRLTIGGATGTSTLTITGNNQFTELASTKTVAHTIALGTTTQTFGAWTVTGTAGNVVTLTGTGASHVLAGACTSGINHLAMGSIGFAATSPGEFYAGVNSTGTAAAPVYRTAKPADSTRYWVGGTGSWSDTARWSTSSGGGSGASVPRSHDDVVFDSLSNATAYTATVNAVTGGIRCKALTIAGPASGNLTLADSTAIDGIHGNVTLPATGLTRTYTGPIALSGSATGRTLTTNGVALASSITVNGVGCGWTLGGPINIGSGTLTVTNGAFSTANFSFSGSAIVSTNANDRTVNLGSSTVTLSSPGTPINFATPTNLTFNAGTSSIALSGTGPTFSGGGLVFNDVSVTSTLTSTVTVNGSNTFTNLSFAGITSAGVRSISLTANQTVTGTLTLSAGTDATMRTFLRSDVIGTTRTLTCAAVTATDIDFRDITIAGAAAPVSGTRLGDCKGNSGITFDAPKTVYPTGSFSSANWGSGIWSTTQGGAQTTTDFPLAQDTVVVTSTVPTTGGTLTLNAAYNIGTIDMSARTSNTMTLATGTQTPAIYGNWINGTGTTLTGTDVLTFAGRGSQTITSAGKTFTQPTRIESPSGAVTLQDAFVTSQGSAGAITIISGTFDANGYNVTTTASGGGIAVSGALPRTVAIGSGTWTITGIGGWNASGSNITVTGTGTISLTSASAKIFLGNGIQTYPTINQGGAGTLTITGNNTFANITNSFAFTGATTIALGTTTQRVGNFTASGQAGRVLTVQGTSASSPATLIFTGSGTAANVDYLTVTGVRAYDLVDTWYAGPNSTNNGSLGWYFEAASGGVIAVFIAESAFANTTEAALAEFASATTETINAADAAAAGMIFLGALSESATAADVVAVVEVYIRAISEAATSSDLVSATVVFASAIAELTNASDLTEALRTTEGSVSETAQASETAAGGKFFQSSVAEASTAADIAAATRAFLAAILEATTAAEIQEAQATFLASVPEQVSGADVAAALITAGASVAESANITDAVLGAYLWNPIDDNQTPNWQNVVNSQGSGWVQVNTDDTPNWQPTIEP